MQKVKVNQIQCGPGGILGGTYQTPEGTQTWRVTGRIGPLKGHLDSAELEKWTEGQLRDQAEEMGIKGAAALDKDALITAISAVEVEAEPTDKEERPMYQAKQTECGQRQRYGDFYRVWEVKTDATQEETVEWCFENLHHRRLPNSADWHKNIRIGGERHGDTGYYFAGYYTIAEIEGGFKFTVVEPNAD